MTGSDRVRGAIERTPIDRIPLHREELYSSTQLAWVRQGMPADRDEQEDFFDYDCTVMYADTSMRFPEKVLEDGDEQWTVADKYGFLATRNKLKPGIHYHEHPMKSWDDWPRLRERWQVNYGPARVHSVSFFAPMVEWPDWAEAKSIFDAKRRIGRHIILNLYGHWEILWRLRGFNEAMMDLVLERENVEDVFERFTTFQIDIITAALEHGIHPDSIYMVDDIGSNQGLMFSREIFREMLLPQYKRLSSFLRQHGIYFILHSCGDVREAIPDFIEGGVQVLNPLQATVMDVVDLKALYGDKLTFMGNINCRTMHDREIVFPEIRRKIPVAARGGGCIFCSDHSIPDTVDLSTYLDILTEVKGMRVE